MNSTSRTFFLLCCLLRNTFNVSDTSTRRWGLRFRFCSTHGFKLTFTRRRCHSVCPAPFSVTLWLCNFSPTTPHFRFSQSLSFDATLWLIQHRPDACGLCDACVVMSGRWRRSVCARPRSITSRNCRFLVDSLAAKFVFSRCSWVSQSLAMICVLLVSFSNLGSFCNFSKNSK